MSVVFALGLGLLLLATAENAAAARKKSHSIHGKIVSIQAGSITVRVHHRKTGTTNQRTVQIMPGTQVTRNGRSVGLAALRVGEHVVIHTSGSGQATRVDITGGTKKNRT
jgi:hypothetical protein